MASQYHYVVVFDFDLPSRRDGFLATNSLLAFIILFSRAYHQLFSKKIELPSNLWILLGHKGSQKLFMEKLRDKCYPLWDRESLVVLYGSLTQAAAYDLESKFTEAALGSIHLSDYRNFAHGRHNWLAKRGDTSAVIALTTKRDRNLAQKTLELLPPNIPSIEFYFPGDDSKTSIAAITTMIYIVSLAGEAKGIDPGRPCVPQFGRKIYHLRLNANNQFASKSKRVRISVQRKLDYFQSGNIEIYQVKFWNRAYIEFIKKLERSMFYAVVFDYDGTLCDKKDRFSNLDHNVTRELVRLLKSGIGIGIATGRGKSVKVALRNALPRQFWKRVIVGYYNGSDCALLANDRRPDGTDIPCAELASFPHALLKNTRITKLSQITIRKFQISIVPKHLTSFDILCTLVNEIVQKHGSHGTSVVTSGHSIDVLAPGVSKRNVVNTLRTMFDLESDSSILCIGDRGRWPGNDFELLQEPLSLSVDSVSSDPKTCWNLARIGHRGVQATLEYIVAFQNSKGKFVIDTKKIIDLRSSQRKTG